MGDEEQPEVEYNAEEGFAKLNLRRPVILYVPSDQVESYDPNTKKAGPSSSLELEWVYGYRGRDCRHNVFALASGEIVYFTASVVVIYNPESKTQRHFRQHTDDIKCLAVHPNGKTVATGQIKGRQGNLPHVSVWDSESLEVLQSFGSDTFHRGVAAIAFSKDGGHLAAVDDAPEPRVSIWNWSDKSKLAEAKAAADPILGVMFTDESPHRVVTSGKNHLAFFTSDNLAKKSGIFGSHEKPKYVTSMISLPNIGVVTADSNGNIFAWKHGGNTVVKSVNGAHEGAIFYLGHTDDGHVISAGKDRKIVLYNNELVPTGESTEIPEAYGSPRVVIKMGDNLIVGTTNNCILQASFDTEVELIVITQGHLEELWGLATHRTEASFVTAGQDGQVFYHDAVTHDTLWKKTLEMACQSADFSLSGNTIVIGGHSGKWAALNKDSQEVVFEAVDGDEPIQVTRFSPDGTKLALGSRDNKVYIYGFNEEENSFSKLGVCEGHSSFVSHLDWSADGELLRTNSGDYEVLFWKLEDFSLITQSEDYKDVAWSTNNCILSFQSIGIWPPGTDGTHVNSCNRAAERPLMATGDDYGFVKLFPYPATNHDAKHKEYHGHSSHVTSVCFFNNDSLLVSAGGRDCTTMQWKISEAEE